MAWQGQLQEGAVQAIYNGDTSLHPVLQVMDVKRINAQPGTAASERYRLVLSDGRFYQQAMLATQLNELIRSGRLAPRCVVQLQEYICNVVQSRRIVIVLNLDVVSAPLDKVIGSPTSIDSAAAGDGTNAQAGAPAGGARPAPPTTAPMFTGPPAAPAYGQAPAPSYGQASTTAAPPMRPPPAAVPPVQPMQGSNFYGNVPQVGTHTPAPRPLGGTGASAMDTQHVFPISSLNPYQNRWTIKARVTKKEDIKRWSNQRGEGKLFSCDLVDKDGTEVRCTFFRDAVDKFYDIIQVDKVYYVSGGSVKMAKKEFTTIKNDYEISMDANGQIMAAPDEPDIPRIRFNFTDIAQIEHLPKDRTVDVIGIVVQVGDLGQITRQTSGEQVPKRDITVLDKSGRTISLTLWGTFAALFQEHELRATPVMACKGVRVGEFNGKNLSTLRSSALFLNNVDIKETEELRYWYVTQGQTMPMLSVGGGARGGVSRSDPKKYLAEVRDQNLGLGEKPDYFVNRSMITFIKHDKTVSYPACPTEGCNKKVAGQEGSFFCEKCQKTFPNCDYRYVLSISAQDFTGRAWFSLFNDQGQQIMNMTAGELERLRATNNTAAFDGAFQDATWKRFNFKVRAAADRYNEEQRVRYTVVSCQDVDYVEECRGLLEEIRSYHP
eukprot:TRINITY_DN269_c2_g1_i1.p2 TRINITY_DN269_c2_g1~~TRINITY_DN269_c2_g1_i1.p2  ORF type:complete len:674 (-),score=142.68 TRINITY_DN269_c2_g1_i1:320-2305(-)